MGRDTVLPTIFLITEDELDLNELLDRITLHSTGAAAMFTGMVRGSTQRGPRTRPTTSSTKPTSRWPKPR